MKAIMYHYVRSYDKSFPGFKYLHIDDFIKQIDYLKNEYGFISKEEFQECLLLNKPIKGVILTFDDGFKDCYRYVLPELLKRNHWGIFYIPTGPFITGKLIDVHRIHRLLGRYDSKIVSDAIREIVTDDMLSHAKIEEFHTETYLKQNNNADTNYVKRLLNYFIDYEYRQSVIDKLMSVYFPNEDDLVQDFYMTKSELEYMHKNGMVLGSHSVSHPAMSKLTIEEQEVIL